MLKLFKCVNVMAVSCILQWLFLVQLFDDANMCRRLKLEKHADEFLAVYTKFVVRIDLNLLCLHALVYVILDIFVIELVCTSTSNV